MSGETARDSRIPDDPHDVLAMVFARPRQAMTAATAMLADGRGPYESSIARQAIGILRREFGDLDAAIRELRQAVRLARRSGSADREADVLATLGIALLQHGRTRPGLSALDTAAALSLGTTRARVLFRRAGARWILGRHGEALDDLEIAAPALLGAGDTVWAARALTLRGHVRLARGSVTLAEEDFRVAQRMFATTSQEHDSVVAVQNRGVVAFRAGDLPLALDLLDEADRGFQALGTPMFDLAADRCAVLLAAGLARDALAQADGALRHLARLRGQATMRAELLLLAARAALLSGDPGTARARAGEARTLFAGQRRAWWAAHARLILVQAALAEDTALAGGVMPSGSVVGRAVSSGPVVGREAGSAVSSESVVGQAVGGAAPARPLAEARRVAERRRLAEARRLAVKLAELGSPEVWQAHLLAGRAALALGRRRAADQHLAQAARARHRGSATARAGGWLAEALRAEAADRPRRLLHACRAGLALIEEHRLAFGSPELRALATAHGAELVTLAQRHWLRAGRPRRLLDWTERWRATSLAVPPVRPPDDHWLLAQLAALRETDHLLGRARSEGASSAATLERDRDRLEARVRAATLRVRGVDGRADGRADGCVDGCDDGREDDRGDGSAPGGGRLLTAVGGGELLAAIGGGRLVELVIVDGVLHALLCGDGRVRRFTVGSAASAVTEIEFARSRLRRLAYQSRADPRELARLGARLERALLGPVAGRLSDGRSSGERSALGRPDGRSSVLGRQDGARSVLGRSDSEWSVLERSDGQSPVLGPSNGGRSVLGRSDGRSPDLGRSGGGSAPAGSRACEPLIVVPPATLHGAPWGLLPALRRRAFSVAPSAAAWLRARSVVPPADGGVVLVRGPGVANADGEVRSIAALYAEAAEPAAGPAPGLAIGPATGPASGSAAGPATGSATGPTTGPATRSVTASSIGSSTGSAGPVTVLADGSATAQGVLGAIDGCHLAHLAAHGTFRADSPSFSSLLLDDGPLTVYDLERLRRAPYRLVLSSCDSGQVAAVGADEVLGPATALLHLGTAGIVASVVPVNDAAAVPVMVALHDGLRRGLGLAEALSEARGDDVSFIAIGAG
ncbi:CHAT domain-containing protein [Nonomuraea sp. NPDC049028]|uniref:CHAT domain-containing protein n=1 Tax=Nonomuraea sp. NPDC049028 TaxID=3364348 RepID=UPI003710847F